MQHDAAANPDHGRGADDAGLALAKNRQDSLIAGTGRMIGRALVLGMPFFLTFLSAAGTAAMIWVGGGIIVHGLEEYGLPSIAAAIHAAADAAAQALSPLAGATEWVVTAAGGALVGLLIGALFIPVIGYVVSPAWKLVKVMLGYERTSLP